MKKKTADSTRAAILHRKPRRLLRTALIIVIYLFVFFILDLITKQFVELPGIVAWYPPAGLTYALLLVMGIEFTPAVTIALLISSLFVYRMPQPAHLLFLWASVISLIYGAAAALLQRVIHFDWQLRRFRDVAWFVLITILNSALLAVLSVTSSALSSNMPPNEVLQAIFHWWIGEAVGVLTITPFLLLFAMPWLKRFMNGLSVKLPTHRSSAHPTLSVMGQVLSFMFMLFWVFGLRIPNEYHPLYLISLPLIWVAIDHGLKGVTLGIVALNFGMILSLWFFKNDPTNLSSLQLLMIVNCIIGLLVGAVVTERKQAEAEKLQLIDELRKLGEVEKKNRTYAEALARNVISLHNTLNTDELLDSIIKNINTVFSADAVNIMLLKGGHYSAVRSRGYKERGLTDWLKNRQFNIDELITIKKVIRSKKYMIIPDTDKSKNWLPIPETFWIKSNIIAPILEDKTVIGFVNVDSARPGFFTEEHARQLAAFTDQVSTALSNARQFEATRRRMQRMQAMTQIDQAINSSMNLNISLEIVIGQAMEQLKADAVDILLMNESNHSLVFFKGKGFKTDEIRKTNLGLGRGLPSRAVLERATVSIPDLNSAAETFFRHFLLEQECFFSYFCVPLITKGLVKGVMEVYFRQPFQADAEWLEFLEMLAQQTAIAINNAELMNSLQKSNLEILDSYDATLKGWVDALDLRDKETEGHSQRVTELSVKLARQSGIEEKDMIHFERGALLHDIGKITIPDAILNKPGPLSEEEWVIVRTHPVVACQVLSKSKFLLPALDIPYCHHEKWDGSGYPRGLKGEEIPLAARIFAIVNVWDVLTSDRPYRKAWSHEKALAHIREQSGKYFDPQVVETFTAFIKEGS